MTETLFGPLPHYQTTDDVYTPPHIFDGLGLTFDLDVCAPPGGLPWVPARRHYSVNDDGLTAPWEGLVWCNPPYSGPGPWVERFLDHGNGVALIPLTKTRWTARVWDEADAIALPRDANGSVNLKWHRGTSDAHQIFWVVYLVAMGDVAAAALQTYRRVR